jgi:hypothetical protein
MKNLEKKCRIQLYDPDFNQVSDRLVSQDTEFNTGPKETHEGPIRIEVSLFDREDIDSVITYLNKLRGAVPIEKPKGKRGRKPLKSVSGKRDGLVEALSTITNPKEFVKAARDMGFIANTVDFLKDMGYTLKIPEAVVGRWVLMTRLLKKAKNPINSKWDPLTLVFIKEDRAIISVDGEIKVDITFSEPLGQKIVVPLKAKMKFPHYLTLEERNQFRLDMDKLKSDESAKPTRLYCRWVHTIAELNPNVRDQFPRINEIPDPTK